MVQRWDGVVWMHEDGEMVQYADHVAAMQTLRAAVVDFVTASDGGVYELDGVGVGELIEIVDAHMPPPPRPKV